MTFVTNSTPDPEPHHNHHHHHHYHQVLTLIPSMAPVSEQETPNVDLSSSLTLSYSPGTHGWRERNITVCIFSILLSTNSDCGEGHLPLQARHQSAVEGRHTLLGHDPGHRGL